MPRSRRIPWRGRLRFGRRSGARVGKYKDPPLKPLLPVDDVVADGLILTLSAVRLALKNRIIVGALRDLENFDVETLSAFARDELVRLADESDDTASRLDRQPDEEPDSDKPARLLAHEDRARRPQVQRALAVALREAAVDETVLTTLVSDAQDNASEEVRRALSSRLVTQRFDLDPDYELERDTRIRALVAIDIDRLLEPPSYD